MRWAQCCWRAGSAAATAAGAARSRGRKASDDTRGVETPTSIHRAELRRLLSKGAELAEVLPKDEYDEEHLPDARHLPLKSLTRAAVADLDPQRPIVVYCWDAL